MTPVRATIWAIGAMALLAAGGCRTIAGDCHRPGAYAAAGELPPLEVPPGLDSPNTELALEIPELEGPEVPLAPDGPCLEYPPALINAAPAASAEPAAEPRPASTETPRRRNPRSRR